MSEGSDRLIYFFRDPLPGFTKKRLASTIGDQNAATIYRAMIEDLYKRFQRFPIPIHPMHREDTSLEFPAWEPAGSQEGRDLGARMERAFERLFDEGANRIILMGSDIPSLTTQIVSDCFRKLLNKPVCIGPSADSGYYLIGFQKTSFLPGVFRNISWSSNNVLDATLAVIRRAELNLHIAPTLLDIDTRDDLTSWAAQQPSSLRNPRLGTVWKEISDKL